MEKLFFMAVLTTLSFQFAKADRIESCRLGQIEIQAEDGRNGGIEVGMVLENGQAISVSDDIQIKKYAANEFNQILSQSNLKAIIDSLHLSLENVSSVQTLKIASDAIVLRLIDESGHVVAKVGQAQNSAGVCESEGQSSAQTQSSQ